jgi:betaine-aldehyde dehydrogenase
MIKGETIPQSDSSFHYTIREPLGVVARIVACVDARLPLP